MITDLADETVVPQQLEHRQLALDLRRSGRRQMAVSRSRIFASPIARSLQCAVVLASANSRSWICFSSRAALPSSLET